MQKVYQFNRLLSIIFCAISVVWLLKSFFLGSYPDFSGYYFGAQYFLDGVNPYHGGGRLYTPYVYPPTVMLLFLPLTLFSYQTAGLIWITLNFILLILCLLLLARIIGIKIISSTNLFLMGLVFISFPVKFSFGMGQINILVLTLLVGSLWLLKQKEEKWFGILIGVSLIVKLFPILLPVYFLLKKKFNILWWITLCIIIGIVVVILLVPQGLSESFMKLIPSFATSWKLDYYNQALAGFVGRSFGTGIGASYLKTFASVVIITISFLFVLKNRGKDFGTETLKISLLITTSVLVNTFSWQHHFVWLIIPFYTTYMFIKKKKNRIFYYLILTASYILIAINFKTPQTLPVLLQSHVFYGAVILLIIQAKLLIDKK